MNSYKYKYLIATVALFFLAIPGVFLPVVTIFIKHNYCSIGLHNNSLFIGDFFRLILPFIYAYIGLTYLSVAKHPDRENKLTRISFWLIILFIILSLGSLLPFGGYLMYINYVPIILMSLPVFAFVILLIGNFNIKYLAIFLAGFILVGGAYLIERNRGCDDEYKLSNETTSLNNAIEKHTKEECKNLSSTSLRNTCYAYLAENKNDPSICESVVNTQDSAASKEMQESCYRYLAMKNLDSKICENINNSDLKKGCVFEATPISIEKCNMISDTLQKDGCIQNLAFEKRDIKICDLTTSSQHKYCISSYATRTKNCEIVKSGTLYPGLYDLCLINTGQKTQ